MAVKVGDLVREDQVVAAVMTDKATVEIPSPVAGAVFALGGAVGDVLAVGSELIRIDAPGLPDQPPPAQRARRVAGEARRQAEAQPSAGAALRRRERAQRRRRLAAAPAGAAAARGREAARLAGRAPARPGGGRRSALRARRGPGRAHQPR